MTLIIYTRCKDATVIILDRKETNTSDVGQITKKYYLPQNHDFLLALAGDSERIDTIVTALNRDQNITIQSVNQRLYDIIENSPRFGNNESMSSGFLLIKNIHTINFNNVWFTNHQSSIVDEDPPFKCYGEGAPLADYIIRKFPLSSSPWNVACQYLITTMQEVSSSIDSVGSLEKFGFDIIVITDSGEIRKCTINDQTGNEKINWSFDPEKDKIFDCLSEPIPEPDSEIVQTEQKITSEKQEFAKIESFSEDTKTKPTIEEDSKSITVSGNTDYVKYSITNGRILDIVPDEEAMSLIIEVQADENGKLTINIPRKIFDSKFGKKDDEFFVIVDGEEMEFDEKKTENVRTLIIPFYKGSEEIEIIGNSFVIQTDKNAYSFGEEMIVTINCPELLEDENIKLEIKQKNGETVFSKNISINNNANGSYQEVIPIVGKKWITAKDYEIIARYGNKTASVSIVVSYSNITVELDQKVYTWTDKIFITVIAPDLVRDQDKVESIGNSSDRLIVITTSKGKIPHYRLEETGPGTGIYTGSITLSGSSDYKPSDDSSVKARGITKGEGPNDGLIASANKDGIKVSLFTPTQTIGAAALIRWNIGEIQWLDASYPVVGNGKIRIVEPDMNLDPDKIDEFEIKVWSDTDPVGVKIKVVETGTKTGIFHGDVYFTSDESSSPKLKVSEGDAITAEYKDKTLPDPYSDKDELLISATTLIGALSPPLERISVTYARFIDQFGNELAQISVGTLVLISTELKNEQEKEQKFAYMVEIQDEKGIQVSLDTISGTLQPNQSLSPSVSWVPDSSGEYTANIFVWESLDNPAALSPPLELKIKAVGNKPDIQLESKEEILPKRSIKSSDAVSDNLVRIPTGSGVPGCEENDECFIPSKLVVGVNQIVVWINEDSEAHTVTSGTPSEGPDGQFDSSLFMSGKSYAHKFKKKGKFPYFCMLHPWQIGEITIK